jgi:hypothetical protein
VRRHAKGGRPGLARLVSRLPFLFPPRLPQVRGVLASEGTEARSPWLAIPCPMSPGWRERGLYRYPTSWRGQPGGWSATNERGSSRGLQPKS